MGSGCKVVGGGMDGSLGRGSLSVLHSLKGLGLGRDHEGRGCWPRHIPGVVFGSVGGLGGLGRHHCGVSRRGLGKARRLSIFLQRCNRRWAGAVPALGAVMHHRLGRGGT